MLKLFHKGLLPLSLFLVSLLAIYTFGLIGRPILSTQQAFPVTNLRLETYDLFDLGVTDINLDGQLDAFTTNHSARQSVVLNDGEGDFRDILSNVELDQDSQFPGLEDSLKQPEFRKPGLYIYRYDRDLYLRSYQLTEPILGSLKLSWPIQIDVQTATEIDIQTVSLPLGGTQATVNFKILPKGVIGLRGQEDIVEVPHLLEIDPALPNQQIYVGLNGIQPPSNQLELMWRDRHSFAWSDLNQDQKMDVFIARGGVKGQLKKVPELILDEMMIATGDVYENQISQFGFEKKDCPGRQAAWVDYNQDDQLDLYIACGRDDDPNYPNLFYQQQPDGTFADVAPNLGIDFPEDGAFRWLDFEKDGDLDLLVTKERAIALYLQNQGRFEPNILLEDFTAKILNLLVADIDADGDLDAYAESKYIDGPNLMLLNEGQTFRPVNPKTVGLPEAGLGASWVDYDNDGFIDFYNVPYGLYRQQPDHHFEATRLLDRRWRSRKSIDARSVWADIDNDGDRDLLSVINQTPPVHKRLLNRFLNLDLDSHWQKLWTSELSHNQTSRNHWLELELSGPPSNPQAIGALVTLKTAHTEQIQSVGNTDSSYFSQGHYRLYFGLGKDVSASLITIRWSNGTTQVIQNLDADKIWQIYSDSEPVSL